MASTLPSEESQSPESREWSLKEELQNNEKLQIEDIDSLKEFCCSLPSVDASMITTELLVALLHSCDYDLDRVRSVATKYFDLRMGCPEMFSSRLLKDGIGGALEFAYSLAFPRRTSEGYQIIYCGLRLSDPSLFQYSAALKIHFLTVDSCIYNNPTIPGYIFIFDLGKLAFGHFFKWSLSYTRTLTKYTEEGIPLKICQLHVVNANPLTYRILRLFKPLVSARLWNMFKLHSSADIEPLYENVPKECLPKEYGGYLPDLESLRKDHIEFLEKMQPRVDCVDQHNSENKNDS